MSEIQIISQQAVTEIVINRPEKKNALTREMYKTMGDAIIEADASEACKVVVIRANGDIFCAGNEISGFANHGKEPHLAETVGFMKALTNCKKPVIAEVSGLAVGIGTTMLLHCDLVYCATGTRFVLPFINLGLVPEYASSYIIPRMAGRRRASEWLMLGEPFSAQDASDFGLVTKIVEPDALRDTVSDVAKKLAAKPKFALLQTKALLNNEAEDIQQHMDYELDIFIEAMGTDAAQEAFDAFLHKRPINPEKFK
ncbi:Enoyl-CoA hydratase/carnithine racemase [Marisediminitalea aggregata]|uniref:Enoyl-CoA hydratase/carnithine racemase n=1 Tax=Marisediminitalea aggregata TaxID=634436 RepID=A0A1M5Q2M2_9ALTE|nr:enoyl-CoA hydratase-related protein [Marisediminitalea aggregata]SHH08324.1 Enoyl-CoA hydratase/carnithine racemase [Marisediminitalea aggregata]